MASQGLSGIRQEADASDCFGKMYHSVSMVNEQPGSARVTLKVFGGVREGDGPTGIELPGDYRVKSHTNTGSGLP